MPIELHSHVYKDTLELIELAESLLRDAAEGSPPPAQECREVAHRLRQQADLLLLLEEKQHNSRNRPVSGQEG